MSGFIDTPRRGINRQSVSDTQWVAFLLRKYADKRGLTGAEFARQLGVDKSTLYAVWNCRTLPSFGMLKSIADTTGIAMDAIFRSGQFRDIWQRMYRE